MRPLNLRMTAFGPFVQEQVVDFSELKGRNFFLIHGPTGSGKTTILDAMCYALYGRSTGSRDTFRSHHADEKTLTSVVFEFMLGDRRLRVERRMTKGGTVIPKLEEMKNGVYTTVVERKDFSDYIRSILGFDVDQFRQVVMLPQGQFSRFLLAGSKEKESILKTLFGTERYEQITLFLKEQYQATKERYTSLDDSRKTILTGQGVDSLEELDKRVSVIEEELGQLEQDEALLAGKLDEHNRRMAAAVTLWQAFSEWDAVNAELQRYRAGEIDRNLNEAKLQEAEKAVRLEPVYQRIEEIKLNQVSIDEQLEKTEKEHAALKQRLQNLQEENQRLADAEPDRRLRRSRIEELKRILPEWEKLEADQHRLRQAKRDLESVQSSLEQTARKREKTLLMLDRLNQELTELDKETALLSRSEKSLDEWKRWMKLYEDLQHAVKKLEARQAESEKTAQSLAELQSRLEEATASIDHLEKEQKKAQAAMLARSLVPGRPCPVCGSTHHPDPAKPSTTLHMEVEDDRLRRLRETYESLRSSREQCLIRQRELEKDQQYHRERIAEVKRELGPWALCSEEERRAEGERRERELHRAREAEKRRIEVRSEQKSLQDGLHTLESELDRLRGLQLSLSTEIGRLDASIASRSSLPGLLSKDPAGKAGMESITQELDRLVAEEEFEEKRIKELQNDYERAIREEASIASKMDSLNERRKETSADLEKHLQAFQLQLQEAGWISEDQFRAAILPSVERERLKQEIQRYDRERQILELRCSELSSKLASQERPDRQALEKEKLQLLNDLSSLQSRKGSLLERKETVETSIQQVQIIDRQMESLRRQRDLWKGLSDAASGVSGRKITLQRYVLAYRLEEVLGHASDRLLRMTQRRYSLRRAVENQDMRQTAGLDLIVHDHRTGKNRPVSSLSGGESFLASLALALALASVVQSEAGGIRLDTIFIDEGFGSLDPEALDLALSTLKQLQEGGRLVGIISHVEEIRHQVEARIEVIPGPSGSRLRWHV